MKDHSVPLGEVCTINPPAPADLHEEVAFVPMASVSEDGTMSVAEHRPASAITNGFSYFQNGDVLVAKITPCYENNKIALVNIDCNHGFGSTEFHVVRADPKQLNPKYLVYFLRQDRVRRMGEQRMTGSAGQRRVPKSFVTELEIPFPPLDEQRRIAAILDQADALRRKRRDTMRRLERLANGAFIELFGNALSNPHAVKQVALGDTAEIVSGITKGRKLGTQPTRTVPYLAVINVQDRALNLDMVKQIDATEDEIARYRLVENDLLLTEGGDPDKLGRGTLWGEEIAECIHQNHIFRVRLRGEEVEPIYLNWLVGSDYGKRYFLRSAKQTTGIASINKSQLAQFPLIVPSRALQQKFAKLIASINTVKDNLEAHLAGLDTLFEALQFQAFSGPINDKSLDPRRLAAE